MTAQTVRFNFNHLLEQWLTKGKSGEEGNTKLNILKTERAF